MFRYYTFIVCFVYFGFGLSIDLILHCDELFERYEFLLFLEIFEFDNLFDIDAFDSYDLFKSRFEYELF